MVVLSHEYWATRFAGDPKVIGRKILVNNYPMTIVGVSGPGFTGMDPASSPQIRVPILMKPMMMPAQQWIQMDNRRARWVQVFARLKPGLHGAIRPSGAAGSVHTDSPIRDVTSRGKRLVGVFPRAVHEGDDTRRTRGGGLFAASQ